jgi:hypothetical protein
MEVPHGVNNRRYLFNTADGRVSKSVSKFYVMWRFCVAEPQSRFEWLKVAGLSNVNMSYRRYLLPLLAQRVIERI